MSAVVLTPADRAVDALITALAGRGYVVIAPTVRDGAIVLGRCAASPISRSVGMTSRRRPPTGCARAVADLCSITPWADLSSSVPVAADDPLVGAPHRRRLRDRRSAAAARALCVRRRASVRARRRGGPGPRPPRRPSPRSGLRHGPEPGLVRRRHLRARRPRPASVPRPAPDRPSSRPRHRPDRGARRRAPRGPGHPGHRAGADVVEELKATLTWRPALADDLGASRPSWRPASRG